MMDTRLFVRLDLLGGMDYTGLVVVDGGYVSGLALDNKNAIPYSTLQNDFAWKVNSPRGRLAVQIYPNLVFANLADRTSRDRVATWLADRVGVPVGSTSPRWGKPWPECSLHRWILNHLGVFYGDRFPPPGAPGRPGTWVHVPALAGLDPHDHTLLPDGSLWVDAAALAMSAIHVGSTR